MMPTFQGTNYINSSHNCYSIALCHRWRKATIESLLTRTTDLGFGKQQATGQGYISCILQACSCFICLLMGFSVGLLGFSVGLLGFSTDLLHWAWVVSWFSGLLY